MEVCGSVTCPFLSQMLPRVNDAIGRPDKDLARTAATSSPDCLSINYSYKLRDRLHGLLVTEEIIDQFLLVPLACLQQTLCHRRVQIQQRRYLTITKCWFQIIDRNLPRQHIPQYLRDQWWHHGLHCRALFYHVSAINVEMNQKCQRPDINNPLLTHHQEP